MCSYIVVSNQDVTVQEVWDALANIPVIIDEDGCEVIDTDFQCGKYFWEKGTEKEEVWHDIENTFHVSVVDDLGLD